MINSVVFSPDSQTIAYGSEDTLVYLLDVSTGQEIGQIIGHSNSVESVAFSPDGKILASASGGLVRLWRL